MERARLNDSSSTDNLTRDLLATYYGIGRRDEEDSTRISSPPGGNEEPKKYGENNETLAGYQEIPGKDTKDSSENGVINSSDLFNDAVSAERNEDVEENSKVDKIDDTQDIFNDKEIREEDDMSSHHLLSDEKNISTTDANEVELPANSSEVLISRKKRKSGKSIRYRASALPALPKRSPIWNESFVDLANSGLREFPGEILDKYSGLRMLYLANNELARLPKELFDCLRRLEWLDVRDNCLTSFPKSVKNHPCLETLLLQGNRVEELPLEICLVPKLRNVQVAGNPLLVPPKVVVDLGIAAILDFFRNEWNKIHPEEPVASSKKDSTNSSTLICCRKPSSLSSKLSKSRSSIVLGENRERGSTGKRYKPNNRYAIPSTNFSLINTEETTRNLSARNFLTSHSARSSHGTKQSVDPEESAESEEHVEEFSKNVRSEKEEMNFNERGVDEIHEKIKRLSGPNGFPSIPRRKSACVGTSNSEDGNSCRVQWPSVDLARLDSARKKDTRRTSGDDSEDGERIFEIVTNDRKKFRVRPLQLENPDLLMTLLKKCVGLNK